MNLHDITSKIDDLYSLTGEEWEITIHLIITEPVCPLVSINPEGWGAVNRYAAWSDGDVTATATRLVDKVYSEIVERKPGTHADDPGQFMDWLRSRWSGSDEKLPRRKSA